MQTFFADLVVLAEEFHPIPFRTRPLKPPAPMVLRPKPRESRSLPGLLKAFANKIDPAITNHEKPGYARNLMAGFFALHACRATREISRGFCALQARRRQLPLQDAEIDCSIFN